MNHQREHKEGPEQPNPAYPKESLHKDWQKPLPHELPQPTAWPFVLGLGNCLLAWGVVTSWVLSLLGLILTIAGIGGWIARLRDEQSP
jgi:hypothetical protein